MNKEKIKKRSKFLSLVLRHNPQKANVKLDKAGWVDVEALLKGISLTRTSMSLSQLREVVETNDKQRFEFSEDGKRIRATQGHSIKVTLGYEPSIPPAILYHGTPQQFVKSILAEGLKKQKRHHVHMHEDIETATAVGQRRGKSVLLTVHAQKMHLEGYQFFVTPNHVWLTDHVPYKFITLD